MKLSFIYPALLASLPIVSALIPIEIKGNRFIRPATNASDEGEVFQVIGVDYQPAGASGYDPSSNEDVLTDAGKCLRDAYVLQNLGINTIRIYTVNPWLNHDECMSIFNSVGIYVVLDVNSALGGESIARHHPEDSYHSGYLNRIFGVVDAFKGYPNLLGFFAGNEVVNDAESAKLSPPYMRAVIRDLKDYIAIHADRPIPVGYSAADDHDLRDVMLLYLECAADEDDTSAADFYGLNSYEWCSGRDDWTSSGYGNLLETFKDTRVPIFLSEYGCNVNRPRTFDEVYDGVYGELATVFSGGLIYEYSEEPNEYGLVEIQDDNSIKFREDFVNLQKAYNQIKLNATTESSVRNITRTTCNSQLKEKIEEMNSDFNASFDLPKCPDTDMLKNGGGNRNIGKVVEVEDTKSPYAIYNVKGDSIVNPEIKISADNQINSPSGGSVEDLETEETTTTTSAPSEPASTSTSSAAANELASGGIAALLFGLLSMLV